MITIPEVFASLALSPASAGRPALRGAEADLTFADLYRNAGYRVAELRQAGVTSGTVVAWVGYNEASVFEYLIAAGELGAALLPLSPALPLPDVVALLADSGAVVCFSSAAVSEDRRRELVTHAPCDVRPVPAVDATAAGAGDPGRCTAADWPRARPSDPAWISTTGGSTGTPRLYAISHERLLTNLLFNANQWGWTRCEAHLALAPLAHGIGFCHAMGQLVTGGTVLLVYRYSPRRATELIAASRTVWTALVPTMLHDLNEHARQDPAGLAPLSLIISAGAPLTAALRDETLTAVPGRRLVEYYGSTELGWVTWIDHLAGDPRNGLIGHPTLGAAVRIVGDDGAVLGPGQVGLIEKRGRPFAVPFRERARTGDEQTRTRWEECGDLAYIDHDGAAVIVGRRDDMVIVGGQNVYPLEVEAALREHPGVNEVIVIGVVEPRLGQELVAFVEPREKSDDSLLDELATFSAQRLPKYKRPRLFARMDSLPRTASGKTNRNSALLRRQNQEATWSS